MFSKVLPILSSKLCGGLVWLLLLGTSLALSIEDRIQANGNVNVRATPGAVNSLGVQSSGSRGVIIDGPIQATFGGTSYTWWKINFDSSFDGWVASIGLISAPPTIQTLAATSVTASSAKLKGTFKSNGAATSAWFQYGPTISYGSSSTVGNFGVNSQTIEFEVSGLQSGTTYHYRIAASNSTGSSQGEDIIFTTVSQPKASIQTQAATSILATAATLNGSINPNGSATTAYFQYGTTSGYGNTTNSGNFGVNSQNIATTITGLIPNTEYHYRIVAQNSGGTAYGNDLFFTTVSLPAIPTPTKFTATGVANGIILNWTDVSATEEGFRIERKQGTSGAWITVGNLGANEVTYTDTADLVAGITYYYRMFAFSGNRASFYTAEISASSNVAVAGNVSLTPAALLSSSTMRPYIDCLVIYTPNAKAAAGSEEAIRSEIAGALANLNQSLSDSIISARIRLVGIREMPYDPVPGMTNDLTNLRGKNDGSMDSVHALRDSLGADIVVLVEIAHPTGKQGGVAYPREAPPIPANEADAFCVVNRPDMLSKHALSHEVGHIFGCTHNRAAADYRGAFDYSYGHLFIIDGVSYGDIMSYATNILPYFSNPEVQYQGIPMGEPESSLQSSNCAKTINNTAAVVGAFRSNVVPTNQLSISNGSAAGVTLTGINAVPSSSWITFAQQFPVNIPPGGSIIIPVAINLSAAPSGYSSTKLSFSGSNIEGLASGVAVIVDHDGIGDVVPALNLVHLSNGGISLQFQASSEKTFTIQRSPDLQTWESMFTSGLQSGSQTWIDATGPINQRMFYRLVTP